MGSPTEPPDPTSPTGTGRIGRCCLLSDLLPTSTAMTGAILGRQLAPGVVATLLDDLSAAGALVSTEGTSATFQLDKRYVPLGRAYAKVAALTTLDLAELAQQGLLIEVSLYRRRREIFRGRFEEPHPAGDLVNIEVPDRRLVARWTELAATLRRARGWTYGGLQTSASCFGWLPAPRSSEGT